MPAVLGFVVLLCLAAGPAPASPAAPRPDRGGPDGSPAGAESVKVARATWDTGWFQTEIFVQLLEMLGYPVDPPQTMENRAFYRSAAEGSVDLWVNGWFPSHNVFLRQEGVGENPWPPWKKAPPPLT